MGTSSAAYDPAFLPIHAYIDYLFAQWQKKHPEVTVSGVGVVGRYRPPLLGCNFISRFMRT